MTRPPIVGGEPEGQNMNAAAALGEKIEANLQAALLRASKNETAKAPPKLAAAMEYALFPGGGRVRPRLTMAVAMACGGKTNGNSGSQPAFAIASALEMLHCASLVHDDMPCFDDAAIRRGKPSVHKRFGEPLALLAGDALIVAAFDEVAFGTAQAHHLTGQLIQICAKSVSAPSGIIAGQAWESEDTIPLHDYHFAKTAALFVAATTGGALAAGGNPEDWRKLGESLGSAYQAADDLRDFAGDEAEIGKPVGQDIANNRPNAVASLGVKEAMALMQNHIDNAVAAVPDCAGKDMLTHLIHGEAKRLIPKSLARFAA